ncbi:MAG: ABC transporter ATP-binding protein, partial [Burkholderiaceae bacterium]
YTDWERVRTAAAQSSSAKTTVKSSAKTDVQDVPAASAKQKKLSYKEQREMEELPILIAKLEAEQKAISQQLADPDLYKQKPQEVRRLNQRFAEIDEQLMEALEKWEAIEARNKA